MGKNVTVQVGDELATKMEKLPDVNWSQVVRGCLEQYCYMRLNTGVVIKSLHKFLKTYSPDKEPARKIELERFKAKWGSPDVEGPDDSPGAEPPYIILEKKIEVKPENTVLTTLRVLNGVRVKPEELTEFDAKVWEKYAFGQMGYIVRSFKDQGFKVGERHMFQPQVIHLVTDGKRRDGLELSRLYEHYALWAVDKEDTVLIAYRQVKR